MSSIIDTTLARVNGTANNSSGSTGTTSAQGMQDQFLTLLVAQLKSQDPMNPMDNAQMTSQMAQISTVSGIEKLNETVNSVTSQFSSMQILQGANLIGRTVLAEGNNLGVTQELDEDGKATGAFKGTAAFDLADSAANVSVTITDAAGGVVKTLEMDAANAGRNYFTWDGTTQDGNAYTGDPTGLRFKVNATNADTVVNATTLAPSAVVATSIANGGLVLELGNGSSINYSNVKAVF